MGRLQADAMAEMDIDLRTAIGWHLQSNHYPPLPPTLVDPCIEAIELANEDDWDAEVDLPEGITYRDRTSAPVWAVVEAHHLESWIEVDA